MSIAKPTGIFAFKWLNSDGITTGGHKPYKWELPIGNNPSKWHSNLSRRPIELCSNGFHCIAADEIYNFNSYGPRLFLVEIAGRFHSNEEKVAVEHMRLIRELVYVTEHEVIKISENVNEIPLNYLKRLIRNKGRIGIDPVGGV